MTDITIPPEAVEAALIERYSKIWHDLSEGQKENLRFIERAACLAMLGAWPGMDRQPPQYGDSGPPVIILPLRRKPMLKAEQIPDEVVEAALAKRGLMREAIADALNAWPGMEARPTFEPSRIILPLLTEKTNVES